MWMFNRQWKCWNAIENDEKSIQTDLQFESNRKTTSNSLPPPSTLFKIYCEKLVIANSLMCKCVFVFAFLFYLLSYYSYFGLGCFMIWYGSLSFVVFAWCVGFQWFHLFGRNNKFNSFVSKVSVSYACRLHWGWEQYCLQYILHIMDKNVERFTGMSFGNEPLVYLKSDFPLKLQLTSSFISYTCFFPYFPKAFIVYN